VRSGGLAKVPLGGREDGQKKDDKCV